MRIVITGATSFVGAAAIQELLENGHEVYAVVRPSSRKLETLTGQGAGKNALREGRLYIVENDLSAPELLTEKIQGSCDAFCHFGWGGSGSGARTGEQLQEENLRASLDTVRAAKALGCRRFLFSGSQAEYGMHQTRMTEETECAPRSAYGEAKLRMRRQGEALCKELGMRYIHLRIFSAYGPGDHPWTLVESCLDAFTGNAALSLGACTQKWNFIYITDLAKAVRALLETPETAFEEIGNPVFNVAGDDTRPLKEFVEEIHRLCKGGGSCLYGDRKENAEGAVNLIPDIGKICRVTGWKPETAFGEGIKKTLESR